MKTLKPAAVPAAVAAAAAVSVLLTAPVFAQDDAYETQGAKRFEASLLGGVQGLMSNDTALPDDFVNIPLVASLAYHITPLFSVEGEFGWLIPVENTVSVDGNGTQDLSNPDILSYQANLRANLPLGAPAMAPYVTAGLGAMTFLSATDAGSYPQLPSSETAFAINFGLGAGIPLTESLSLRGDIREFVAFPQNDAAGLSDGTDADPIWMPRGTVGVAYRFLQGEAPGTAQTAAPAPVLAPGITRGLGRGRWDSNMSQRNVERVIGRLVTDEAFRFEFVRNPEAALRALTERGIELTECELDALRMVDPRMVSFFADTIDPSLQKTDLGGGLK